MPIPVHFSLEYSVSLEPSYPVLSETGEFSAKATLVPRTITLSIDLSAKPASGESHTVAAGPIYFENDTSLDTILSAFRSSVQPTSGDGAKS